MALATFAQRRAPRRLSAAFATVALAATILILPMAQPSRADSTISVANEAEYRAALNACEALAESELCVVQFTSDIEMTAAGGSPEYDGEADIHLIGVGAQREIFTNETSYLQFFYSPGHVEVTIENLRVRDFQWGNAGGSVGKWNGDLTIIDSVFEDNTGSGGGAVYFYSNGTLTVSDSVFDTNTSAGPGGAIITFYATVNINRSVFTSNVAFGGGGAVSAQDGAVVTIDDSTFDGNSASFGGAIRAADTASINATNTTFYGNEGGAVRAAEGAIHFTHVTAADNVPNHVEVTEAAGTFTTFGSVFQKPSDAIPACSIAGTAQSLGYNWAATDDCWTTSTTGDVTDGDDPLLTELANNGGPTKTARPQYQSDLINAIAAGDCEIVVDQRGVARPQGTTCDIGAVELVAPFPDVPIDYQFAEDIFWLSQTGITGGYDDGTFRPSVSVSRQAMAAFLYRFADVSGFTPPVTPTFPDVPVDHQFYDEIEWLASTGITGGYDDGTFRPSVSVSRQAMAAFLYRFAEISGFTPPVTATFTDVPVGHQFDDEIEWLASTGITQGYDDGTFRPSTGVSRQAAAAFLHRLDALGLG